MDNITSDNAIIKVNSAAIVKEQMQLFLSSTFQPLIT